MILLLGGTGDSKALAKQLESLGIELILSTATPYGESLANSGFDGKVISGTMDEHQMTDFCIGNKIQTIIDATHPYAQIVSQTAIHVARLLSIQYLRFERPGSNFNINTSSKKVHYFPDFKEACSWMESRKGNILFTTGSKDVPTVLLHMKQTERLIFRVLPLSEPIKMLESLGIQAKQIIAIQGPFSTEMNVAMIRHYNVSIIVTKDSGKEGFVEEKLIAADQCNCELVVIERPKITYPLVFSEFEPLIEYFMKGAATTEVCN